jgi:hypothetical protein
MPNDLAYGVRLRGGELIGAVGMNGIGLVVTLGLFVLAMTSSQDMPALAVLPVGFAANLWRLPKPWLFLSNDRLLVRTLAGWREIRRDEIKGLRTVGRGRSAWLEVVPKSPHRRGARLKAGLFDDPWVSGWFGGACDLTREALYADIVAITCNPRLGSTRSVRKARLRRAGVMAFAFNLACCILAAGLYFLPAPYWSVLAAEWVTPILAGVLISLSFGLVVPLPRADTIRPNVAWALAPMAVATTVALQTHLIDSSGLFTSALVIGSVAMGLFWLARPRSSNDRRLIGLIGLGCACAVFNLMVLANVGFDSSPRRTFAVQVQDKQVTGSRAPSHDLLLPAWADQPAGWIPVGAGLYGRTRVGSTVCLSVGDGALALRWFVIDDCPAAVPAARRGQAKGS